MFLTTKWKNQRNKKFFKNGIKCLKTLEMSTVAGREYSKTKIRLDMAQVFHRNSQHFKMKMLKNLKKWILETIKSQSEKSLAMYEACSL